MADAKTIEQTYVPIIGRTNVGKSTLFNKLIGDDRAITGDDPGVTRDRISEQLEWHDHSLTLLDTAGYTGDEGSEDSFVVKQVDSLIDRGECLVYVVDGGQGITPLDRRVAEKLYPHSENVILVVNKVDPGRDAETIKSEFYELGFSEVHTVSALHERGLDKLKRVIANHVPEREVELSDEKISLSLIGRPNVGKSTLFNAIIGYDRVDVSEEPGTTRDFVDVSFDYEGNRFHLMDTGGILEKKKIEDDLSQEVVYRSLSVIHRSDIVCLMLDWNQRVTKQDQRIAGLISDRYRGCSILVNKADQPDEDNEDNWMAHLQDRLYFIDYAPVLFTSGVERRGLRAIFDVGTQIYNEMHTEFDADSLTNALLDVKSSLQWPGQGGKSVILQEIRQIGTDPVSLRIKAAEPEKLGSNDIRYLKRQLREKLNLEVSPIKVSLVEEFEDDQ